MRQNTATTGALSVTRLALAGAGIPLLLRRLGQDPAVSSAVFVTTFTDIFGFLFFLGLATALLVLLL